MTATVNGQHKKVGKTPRTQKAFIESTQRSRKEDSPSHVGVKGPRNGGGVEGGGG